MSARPVLALGLGLGLCACATVAPQPDRPQVVQLSLSGSPDPCDWKSRHEPLHVPDQWALGASYWPHTMPRPGAADPARTVPLAFYGASTHFSASPTAPVLCLRLFRRPSLTHDGMATVAVVEIRPEGETARVSAWRRDRQITRLDLGFRKSAVQVLAATLIGGQLVEVPAVEAAATGDPDAPEEALAQTLTLDMRTGHAQGRITSPSYAHLTHLALVASQAGGKDGAQDALALILSTPARGPSEARFRDGHLVLGPHRP